MILGIHSQDLRNWHSERQLELDLGHSERGTFELLNEIV